jgi:hypothetical protein
MTCHFLESESSRLHFLIEAVTTLVMAEEAIPEWRKQMNTALVVESDLNEDTQTEAIDCIASTLEKYHDIEQCAKSLKEDLDRKTGPGWQVVVGEDFSHFVTYTTGMLFAYFAGNMGVLIWK